MTKPVVVIGAGIAGLSAGWELQRHGVPFAIYEATDRPGGKLRTTEFAGRRVDEAADAFLARVPDGIELAHELGLGDELIAPTARKAQVWVGELHRLPEPNVLGIPLDPAAAEAMLGTEAAAAIEADLARTEPDPVRPDDTIGTLVRRRLGDRVHESLVDPLIGAINAGDTDDLSLEASSIQIYAAAQASPSLTGSFRSQMARRDPDAPVFHSFADGMQTLVDALADRLGDAIELNAPVDAVTMADRELSVATDAGAVAASAVIVATPAPVAAGQLPQWERAQNYLHSIPMVSVTLVTLAFPAGTITQPRDLSGFVVSRTDPALTITACSYTSSKWPHLGGDVDLVRVSVGHGRDADTPALDDEALLQVIRRDLATAIGLTAEPAAVRFSRWPAGFPQYRVGHLDRLAEAEAELHRDGVFLAGMSHRGIGVPANIRQGRTAARAAIAKIESRREAR